MIQKNIFSISALIALSSIPFSHADEKGVKVQNDEAAKAESVKRPNIVFLMTDDQRWDTLGCYGRTDVMTPHIDKLSANGVTFDNAYHAVAICMPSRTTMFTGRYFSDHQVGFTYPYNRTLPAEEFADSYPAQLKALGYRTGFVGKFGIRLENLEDTLVKHFDYYTGKSTTSKEGPHFPVDDEKLNEIYRKDRNPKERTLIKGDSMIHFLETQPKGQPFCLSVSFDAVKNDRNSEIYEPHEKLFEGKKMWVPDNYVAGKNGKLPKVLDYCRGTYLHVQRTSTLKSYQKRTRRFAVQGYTVDQQVKRLMEKLEEIGELDNTVVIYTSDNGRFHGAHGLFDKAILYDEAVRQPLIVFDPRVDKSQRGSRVEAMVSSVDVAPTILALAGADIPDSMKGSDLGGLLSGKQNLSKWREAVLMENFFLEEIFKGSRKKGVKVEVLNKKIVDGNRSYRSRGVRTDRYKYFAYHEHDPVIEELYDLKNDPYEQTNLINNEEYIEVLAKMRQETEMLLISATEE